MIRLCVILTIISAFQLNARHQKLTLQKALDKKQVVTSVTSKGDYQGFCMTICCKNLSRDSLIIMVEAGRRLNSLEDKNQDILIVKEELIVLRPGEIKHQNVKGYCCQATMHAPEKGAKYDVNILADSNLVKLARYLNKKEFDTHAEQEAVWAISDKHPSARIASGNDSLTQLLREMVAHLKGEELPWYRIISKKHVFNNGVISIVNLKLQGFLSYSNEKEDYATLTVINEKGLLVCQVQSEWIKTCVNQNYKLNLPIKGLAKGKYTIELKTSEKQLAKQEFEI